jgi:hypothetical protein
MELSTRFKPCFGIHGQSENQTSAMKIPTLAVIQVFGESGQLIAQFQDKSCHAIDLLITWLH